MSLYNVIDRSKQATVRQAYRLVHDRERRARYNNHLTFLLRCRRHHLIPNGLRARSLVHSAKSERIVQRASIALLRERIEVSRTTKVRIERCIDTSEDRLKTTLSKTQWTALDNLCKQAESRTHLDTRMRQKAKFEWLLTSTSPTSHPSLDKSKVVINMSERQLTPSEEEVLALGLNFAITPAKVPTSKIIAATEATARHLFVDSAEQLRAGVNQALTNIESTTLQSHPPTKKSPQLASQNGEHHHTPS